MNRLETSGVPDSNRDFRQVCGGGDFYKFLKSFFVFVMTSDMKSRCPTFVRNEAELSRIQASVKARDGTVVTMRWS